MPNMESPVILRVADLLDVDGCWCEAALATHITKEDAGLAREIPLSIRRPKDIMY